jgi:hypothetical protein
MRWQELFADLEAQARSLERVDAEVELPERIRGEVARVLLMNRLRAQLTRRIRMSVWGFGELSGQLQRTGADWLLIQADDEVIVPAAAILSLIDLPPEAISPEAVGHVASSLRLSSVLRAVAKDRSVVTVTLRDGRPLVGTPDRVGADFVDLAVHDVGEAPRQKQVRSRATVSFGAIACVRRRPTGWE